MAINCFPRIIDTVFVQVSGQLEGIEGILNSQPNITNQILDNVEDKLYLDGVQGIEAVFIAFLKSKLIFTAWCAVDRHRFDAKLDPDLNPNFYVDADPDWILIGIKMLPIVMQSSADPTLSFTHVGKSDFFITFIHSNTSLRCFIFPIRQRCCNFPYLRRIMKFSGKKV